MKNKRRILTYFLLAALVVSMDFAKPVKAAGVPKTRAHAYYVLDADTGKKIVSSRANKKIYPASTVKLLTALTVLEHTTQDYKITYTKKIRKQIPYDAAALNLKTGRVYTVKQYLHMLLMVSDAGSAIALSVGTAGSMDQFVEWMNDKAQELGMKDSHFDNPIGLDVGSGYKNTYTTAADFAKVSKAAMENATIRNIVAKRKYKVSPVGVNKSFKIKNTNAFYFRYKKMVKGKSYKIIGSKTGTTKAAGHALVATAVDEDGHEVIVCFYGNGGYERMYKDIRKLFDYAYSL